MCLLYLTDCPMHRRYILQQLCPKDLLIQQHRPVRYTYYARVSPRILPQRYRCCLPGNLRRQVIVNIPTILCSEVCVFVNSYCAIEFSLSKNLVFFSSLSREYSDIKDSSRVYTAPSKNKYICSSSPL